MLEVSIGHALVTDALWLGLEETIQRYLACPIRSPSPTNALTLLSSDIRQYDQPYFLDHI